MPIMDIIMSSMCFLTIAGVTIDSLFLLTGASHVLPVSTLRIVFSFIYFAFLYTIDKSHGLSALLEVKALKIMFITMMVILWGTGGTAGETLVAFICGGVWLGKLTKEKIEELDEKDNTKK